MKDGFPLFSDNTAQDTELYRLLIVNELNTRLYVTKLKLLLCVQESFIQEQMEW